jgi:hypothetical protein
MFTQARCASKNNERQTRSRGSLHKKMLGNLWNKRLVPPIVPNILLLTTGWSPMKCIAMPAHAQRAWRQSALVRRNRAVQKGVICQSFGGSPVQGSILCEIVLRMLHRHTVNTPMAPLAIVKTSHQEFPHRLLTYKLAIVKKQIRLIYQQ